MLSRPSVGDEAQDDEKVLGGFCDPDALLLDDLRQARLGKLEFVLDLNLGDVGVGPLVEAQRDRDAPVLIAVGRKIQQVVDPAELLLDNLHHGALYRFGRGAGICHGDRDGRRCDRRVLRDRELQDGDGAGEHQDDGKHPGKYRAVDEEARHGAGLLLRGRG